MSSKHFPSRRWAKLCSSAGCRSWMHPRLCIYAASKCARRVGPVSGPANICVVQTTNIQPLRRLSHSHPGWAVKCSNTYMQTAKKKHIRKLSRKCVFKQNKLVCDITKGIDTFPRLVRPHCAKPCESFCGSAVVATCRKLNVSLCELLNESFVFSNQITKNGKNKMCADAEAVVTPPSNLMSSRFV